MKLQNNLFVTTLIVLVIWMLITMYGEILQAGIGISLTELVSQQIVIALILAPLFLLAVIAFFKWDNLGLNFPTSIRSLTVIGLPTIYIAGFLGFTLVKGFPAAQVVTFVLINALLVGISEELMFRGILFKSALSQFTVWKAIWISSIIFGAIHALNAFVTGDISTAFAQAIAATMSGIWFMAIRIRTGSLMPVMIVHGLWDFSIFMLTFGPTTNEAASPSFLIQLLAPSLLVLPLFIYGLFILRDMDKSDFSFKGD